MKKTTADYFLTILYPRAIAALGVSVAVILSVAVADKAFSSGILG